jgi:hypothetical protein
MTSGVVGSVGLLCDIAGAVFLTESFVVKRRKEAVREARSYMDGNIWALRGAIQQGVEARIGAVFLVFGFLGQYVSYSSWVKTAPNHRSGWMLVCGGVTIGLVVLCGRRVAINAGLRAGARTWGQQTIEVLKKELTDPASAVLGEYADSYGEEVAIKRRADEPDAAFANRVVAEIKRWM